MVDTDQKLYDALSRLQQGDQVIPEYRSRPLTVVEEMYVHQPPRSVNKYRSVELEGNGCLYRLSTLNRNHSDPASPWLSISRGDEWEMIEDVYGMMVIAARVIIEDVNVRS